jgi:hypothetical protein
MRLGRTCSHRQGSRIWRWSELGAGANYVSRLQGMWPIIATGRVEHINRTNLYGVKPRLLRSNSHNQEKVNFVACTKYVFSLSTATSGDRLTRGICVFCRCHVRPLVLSNPGNFAVFCSTWMTGVYRTAELRSKTQKKNTFQIVVLLSDFEQA